MEEEKFKVICYHKYIDLLLNVFYEKREFFTF